MHRRNLMIFSSQNWSDYKRFMYRPKQGYKKKVGEARSVESKKKKKKTTNASFLARLHQILSLPNAHVQVSR